MAVFGIFAEPSTLYDCQKHLCRLQYFLCGCNYWRARAYSPNAVGFVITLRSRLYPMCATLVMPLVVAYCIYSIAMEPLKRDGLLSSDQLLLSIAAFELVGSVSAFIVTSASMQWQSAQLVQLYDRLQALDTCLQTQFGANLHYRKLMRKLIALTVFLICPYTLVLINAVWQLDVQKLTEIRLVVYCYTAMTIAIHFNCFMQMHSADLLRIRFRLLQKILQQKHLSPMKLERAVQMVKQLHRMVPDINAIFKFSMIVSMLHDFTLVTSELYTIFGHTVSGKTNSNISVYIATCMTMPLYKVIIAPIYSDLAIKEGEKCLRLIEQLEVHYGGLAAYRARDIVRDTLYWRLENKVCFLSGMQIVYNRGIIAGVMSAIVSYMFILMQFQFTKQIGDQIDLQKNMLQDWIGDDNPI